jgi:hypothetical protein
VSSVELEAAVDILLAHIPKSRLSMIERRMLIPVSLPPPLLQGVAFSRNRNELKEIRVGGFLTSPCAGVRPIRISPEAGL